MAESTKLCHELASQGRFLGASPLHPVATSTCVRVRSGNRLTTDGPFAETTEQLGGYFLIDVANLDEAIAIAGRIPAARKGTVEVRPSSNCPACPRLNEHHRQPLEWGDNMRVIVLVKASKDSEAGVMPTQQLLTEMGQFNEELVKAGIMLAGEGLHPSSKGVRVRFSGKERTVIDGPFAETKELVAGYWIWQVKSMDEAIAWLQTLSVSDDRGFGCRDSPDFLARGFWRGLYAGAAKARGTSSRRN